MFGIASARWPDGPLPSGVTQGLYLIPISGVGEAVGGVSEAVGGEKMGGNGGRRNIQQWHDLWRSDSWTHTNKSSSPWAKRVITSGVRRRAQRESARVCVPLRCYLYMTPKYTPSSRMQRCFPSNVVLCHKSCCQRVWSRIGNTIRHSTPSSRGARGKGDFWFQSVVLTKLKVVTENTLEMKQWEEND